MPYNYFPNSYQYPQPYQNQQNGLIWVQGEAAAKSYPVAANASVLLMDSEKSSFYIKSADASGMPLPLRVFDYTERTVVPQNQAQAAQLESQIDFSAYVTREEFEKRLAQFAPEPKKKEK